mmetsp:Transcript_38287/g.100987  ORF Transcript_38287/g.100987 Transcript_38287/m.100987 type:complete len:183 (+) Transcript_38287:1-549(+)
MQVEVGTRVGDSYEHAFRVVERNSEGRRGGGSSDPFAMDNDDHEDGNGDADNDPSGGARGVKGTLLKSKSSWRAAAGKLGDRLVVKQAADDAKNRAYLDDRLQRLQHDILDEVSLLLGKGPRSSRPQPVRIGAPECTEDIPSMKAGAGALPYRVDTVDSWTGEEARAHFAPEKLHLMPAGSD